MSEINTIRIIIDSLLFMLILLVQLIIYPAFHNINVEGFYYKFKWDINTKSWIADRDKNGNLMVGEIYSKSAIKSLETNDRILKINDKKINNTDDFNQEYLNSERIKVELKDKDGEIYLAYLDKEKNEHSKIYYNFSEMVKLTFFNAAREVFG